MEGGKAEGSALAVAAVEAVGDVRAAVVWLGAWPHAATITTASAASNLIAWITGANCDR